MTTEEIQRLVSEAEEAGKRAVAPYSGFKVGAALMTRGGMIFTASNVENPSLMLTACAERIALLNAVSSGQTDIAAMAVVSEKGGRCFPCGSCRQALYEFAPDAAIYLKAKDGIKKFTLEELLPYPFQKG